MKFCFASTVTLAAVQAVLGGFTSEDFNRFFPAVPGHLTNWHPASPPTPWPSSLGFSSSTSSGRSGASSWPVQSPLNARANFGTDNSGQRDFSSHFETPAHLTNWHPINVRPQLEARSSFSPQTAAFNTNGQWSSFNPRTNAMSVVNNNNFRHSATDPRANLVPTPLNQDYSSYFHTPSSWPKPVTQPHERTNSGSAATHAQDRAFSSYFKTPTSFSPHTMLSDGFPAKRSFSTSKTGGSFSQNNFNGQTPTSNNLKVRDFSSHFNLLPVNLPNFRPRSASENLIANDDISSNEKSRYEKRSFVDNYGLQHRSDMSSDAPSFTFKSSKKINGAAENFKPAQNLFDSNFEAPANYFHTSSSDSGSSKDGKSNWHSSSSHASWSSSTNANNGVSNTNKNNLNNEFGSTQFNQPFSPSTFIQNTGVANANNFASHFNTPANLPNFGGDSKSESKNEQNSFSTSTSGSSANEAEKQRKRNNAVREPFSPSDSGNGKSNWSTQSSSSSSSSKWSSTSGVGNGSGSAANDKIGDSQTQSTTTFSQNSGDANANKDFASHFEKPANLPNFEVKNGPKSESSSTASHKSSSSWSSSTNENSSSSNQADKKEPSENGSEMNSFASGNGGSGSSSSFSKHNQQQSNTNDDQQTSQSEQSITSSQKSSSATNSSASENNSSSNFSQNKKEGSHNTQEQLSQNDQKTDTQTFPSSTDKKSGTNTAFSSSSATTTNTRVNAPSIPSSLLPPIPEITEQVLYGNVNIDALTAPYSLGDNTREDLPPVQLPDIVEVENGTVSVFDHGFPESNKVQDVTSLHTVNTFTNQTRRTVVNNVDLHRFYKVVNAQTNYVTNVDRFNHSAVHNDVTLNNATEYQPYLYVVQSQTNIINDNQTAVQLPTIETNSEITVTLPPAFDAPVVTKFNYDGSIVDASNATSS